MTGPRCPEWCAGGHHCTARLPAGEHASIPEVWTTGIGRVVATRYQNHRGTGHVEVRVILRLDPSEQVAQAQCRHLIATTYQAVTHAFSSAERGHLRHGKEHNR